ncbi:MAG TPA: nitroreductase family protein [Spirochaetia bacterium]|nr:nitroreductase family protein [Spirochaetia bacterium]
MVVIDRVKCTGCGSCVKVCHEHCMALVGKTVEITFAACSTCTQCIAICPEKALSWDGVQPVGFDRALLPSAAQLEELLLERRTVRAFTSEPVAREELEGIVAAGPYAPTHAFNLRYVIIDDPQVIEAFDGAALGFSKRVYSLLFRPRLIRALAQVGPAVWREEFNKALPKLETVIGRDSGFGPRPAALVCIVGDKRVPLSLESAQYALYNISLAAQVAGLGCRNLVGNLMIFNRNREVRRALGLKQKERIFAIAGFGHPSVSFKNKVPGRKAKIQWNGERS